MTNWSYMRPEMRARSFLTSLCFAMIIVQSEAAYTCTPAYVCYGYLCRGDFDCYQRLLKLSPREGTYNEIADVLDRGLANSHYSTYPENDDPRSSAFLPMDLTTGSLPGSSEPSMSLAQQSDSFMGEASYDSVGGGMQPESLISTDSDYVEDRQPGFLPPSLIMDKIIEKMRMNDKWIKFWKQKIGSSKTTRRPKTKEDPDELVLDADSTRPPRKDSSNMTVLPRIDYTSKTTILPRIIDKLKTTIRPHGDDPSNFSTPRTLPDSVSSDYCDHKKYGKACDKPRDQWYKNRELNDDKKNDDVRKKGQRKKGKKKIKKDKHLMEPPY